MRHYALALLALPLAGCDTAPPKPASVPHALVGERIDQQGAIRSVSQAPTFAVMVKKLNDGDASLNDLAQHGLPVTIVFANLSGGPVSFGPENVNVMGAGDSGPLSVLTADDISDIKNRQETANNVSSFFDVLFAVAGTAQAGQMMQSGALSQSQATALAQGYATLATSDILDNQAANQKIEQNEATLIDHYQAVVLEDSTVDPKGQTGGVVFVRNATPDTPLTIRIRTGSYTHVFQYLTPEQAAQEQQSAQAASQVAPSAQNIAAPAGAVEVSAH
jgi:hypothetical protein